MGKCNSLKSQCSEADTHLGTLWGRVVLHLRYTVSFEPKRPELNGAVGKPSRNKSPTVAFVRQPIANLCSESRSRGVPQYAPCVVRYAGGVCNHVPPGRLGYAHDGVAHIAATHVLTIHGKVCR